MATMMINSRANIGSQTVINSTGSVRAESEGPIDSVENISVVSDSDANENNDTANNKNDNENVPTRRRKRWALFRRVDEGDGDGPTDNTSRKFKAMSVTCRCKSAFQGSCLITCSSVIELVGNLLALVYGIAFIQSACNFYEIDTSSEKKIKEYDENLERVLFLEKNRVGFVGLLATCLIGLIVSFLMPFGTIYKSWKSLRAAMSLLFSICLAHIILASVYLYDHELMATLAAIPFRVYEILLIYNHINVYKKKKLEEARKAMEAGNGDADNPIDSQDQMGSFNSIEQVNATGSQENPLTSDMQLSFNVTGNKGQKQQQQQNQQNQEGEDTFNEYPPDMKERKSSMKRRMLDWGGDREQRKRGGYTQQPDAYVPADEYK